MRLLLVDNEDSFTFNIVDLIKGIGVFNFKIISIKELSIKEIKRFDKVIISPGPGIPQELPKLYDVIDKSKNKSLLGVCLGHQALCEYFGGKLINLNQVVHGRKKIVKIQSKARIYKNIPNEIEVGLYHSWVVDMQTLPDDLFITGLSKDNLIMSVEHKEYDMQGIQFHPESFMTKFGKDIILNFLKI